MSATISVVYDALADCGEPSREWLAETSRSTEIPLDAVSEIGTRLLEQQLALQEAAARKMEDASWSRLSPSQGWWRPALSC